MERFARNITWKRKIFRLVYLGSFKPLLRMLYILHIPNCGLLYFSELDGIKTALTQCKEIGRVKQVLSRRDLLLKVKHYDSMLSNVLQRLQVCRRLTIPGHSSNSSPAAHADFRRTFRATRLSERTEGTHLANVKSLRSIDVFDRPIEVLHLF